MDRLPSLPRDRIKVAPYCRVDLAVDAFPIINPLTIVFNTNIMVYNQEIPRSKAVRQDLLLAPGTGRGKVRS